MPIQNGLRAGAQTARGARVGEHFERVRSDYVEKPDDSKLAVRAFGLNFPNPIGMAAGFDKSGEVPDALLRLGFGFVEVGRMPEVGCKFGRWLDMVFMQKRLATDGRP